MKCQTPNLVTQKTKYLISEPPFCAAQQKLCPKGEKLIPTLTAKKPKKGRNDVGIDRVIWSSGLNQYHGGT